MVNRMLGLEIHDTDHSEFVEVDPTGRYGRYNEILGKGSSKTVYRAFDEYEGIEVAWNQVKLYDFLQSPEDLERLYCEIHLLKTLKHKNIMKFYTSWVDTSKRNINFITEMFTSGTLRQYREKHRRVNIRAVKQWCRQILCGLLYLHSHEPPIIHRDLKCDNIFINGNQGEVKIGDLGLAAILRKSHAANCVGTPEFMAPEIYAEEYNELVDIYSFGMCVLEMVTFEYPYSECTHPAQIYKKVISGTKPEALYKVKDPEVREFVEKCLATAAKRLSARELLKDPFLQVDDSCSYLDAECNSFAQILRQPSTSPLINTGSIVTHGCSHSSPYDSEIENGWDCSTSELENHGINLFSGQEDEDPPSDVDITIKGRRNEDGGIFLRLRIADKEARVRNIYFRFDIEADTALSVATEMVAELDITDHDVTRIAEMIDGEVSLLVPGWKLGPGIEEIPGLCENCKSNVSSCGSLLDYLSYKNPGKPIHCSRLECAALHGRFEEITYQVEGSEEQCFTEGAPALSSSPSDGIDLSSHTSLGTHSEENEQSEQCDQDTDSKNQIKQSSVRDDGDVPLLPFVSVDFEKEIHQELRWLKAKYQTDLTEYKTQKFGELTRLLHESPHLEIGEHMIKNSLIDSFHLAKRYSPRGSESNSRAQVNIRSCRNSHADLGTLSSDPDEANLQSSPQLMLTAKNFYGSSVQSLLPRASSLPVDAVDV